jgi:predicted nucleic acid-binding protein
MLNSTPYILFLIKESKTQDATLLTTAILNEADYFVTLDEPRVRSAKKKMAREYVNPTEGLQVLHKRMTA